jgi:hypothetical protein
MKRKALLGSAGIVIGVANIALLAPQAASALNFNFSFGGVEGIIEGLVEGSNPCDSSQPTCRVSVTNAGVSGAQTGLYSLSTNALPTGTGFTVSGGLITEATWGFAPHVGETGFASQLAFSLSDPIRVFVCEFGSTGCLGLRTFPSSFVAGPVTFTPSRAASAVPGPLPVLGAVAALGYSRRLRKRIKGSTPVA